MTEDVALVPLRNWKREIVAYALVDSEDEEMVSAYRWTLHASGYATAHIGGRGVLMHRLLLGLSRTDDRLGDHINRNRLDNRRENLRVLDSRAESNQNKSHYRNHSSHFRGVSRMPRARNGRERWRARARLNGEGIHLGVFPSEREAADAAARFRREHMPYSEDAR